MTKEDACTVCAIVSNYNSSFSPPSIGYCNHNPVKEKE